MPTFSVYYYYYWNILESYLYSQRHTCPDGWLDTQFWSSLDKDVLPILPGPLGRDLAWPREPAGSHLMDLF